MAPLIYALTTKAKVKTFLDISVTTWDSLFDDLIDEATDFIEDYCGDRRLLGDTDRGGTAIEYTEYYNGNGKVTLRLRKWPIISITSIAYATGNLNSPTWNVLDATNQYAFDPMTGEVRFASALPFLTPGLQNIRVIYKAGYVGTALSGASLLPKNLELACIKLVAKEFNKRKSQGITNESIGGGSIVWEKDMDPSVKSVLDSYKRLSF